MPTPSEGTPTKRKIGPFVLEGKLGAGGMGVVYKATYDETGQEVALKVLPPTMSGNPQVVARFEREIAILKRMKHPHIVRYFGGGRSGGQQYFAMEYVPGGSVERLVKTKGKLPWEQVLGILRQVAEALEYAHTSGVIHRDLKPANLFFGTDGKVKLGDFGIARDGEATALTAAGKTVGTYGYMAPEQIAGKPPISRRTDLYALGCVGFELLTGRTPFVAETPAEMLFGHLNEEPPRVRDFSIDCPIWLDEVISKLLEKDPEDRYFDALAVQVALDEVKEKVAQQESFAKQTLMGATAAAGTAEGKALKELVGKPKKKRKKKGPIYERVWFLALCFFIIVGGITWAAWPAGEAELYAAAEALMKSENTEDWQTAKTEYLQPLLARFPESERARQAREWIDKADLGLLERQTERLVISKRDPRNEAERLLVEAWRSESDDRLVAAAKYEGLIRLLEGEPESRLYVALARKRLKPLAAGIAPEGEEEKAALLEKALEEADRLYLAGKIGKAQDKWKAIVSLYGDDPEFAAHVRFAQARLAGEEPTPPDLGAEEEERGPDGG